MLSILGLFHNINAIFLRASTSDVVERELRQSGNVLKSEEAQLVQVLISTVSDNSHNSEIWLAGVIDEPGRTSYEFTVNFIWFTLKAGITGLWVVELVETK
jgi:hypothetical protein